MIKAIQKIVSLSLKAKNQPLFSSIAFRKNVFLPAHTDKDFGYSVVMTFVREPEKTGEDILCYFVFPEHGQKVTMRNLDFLIFIPQVYHCVSKRVTHDDVYCASSFYMKTAVVGKNDNSIPLNDLEQCICNNY